MLVLNPTKKETPVYRTVSQRLFTVVGKLGPQNAKRKF